MKRVATILLALMTLPLFADQESGGTKEAEAKEKPKFTAKFGARVQLDYAWYDDERDDGGEMRRGRLEVKGDIGEEWNYKLTYEFAGDEPELRDGLVQYEGLGSGVVTAGHYKQPSSLEALMSSKNTTFLESGMVTALAEGRRMGVAYSYSGPKFVAMGSAYGDEANGAAEGSGVIGRGVWLPVRENDKILHLGGSLSRNEPQDGVVRVSVRPDSHVTDDRILDTGRIEGVESTLRTGLEAAVAWERFSAQAEYIRQDLSRVSGSTDPSFDGWYAYASWFLTPDRRGYDDEEAIFDKVSPSRRGGAWEVALRYQTMDLTDEDVAGGSANAWTAALNWYPNDYLRFMLNYSMVDSDEVAGNDDPNVVQVRMQFAF